MRIFFLLVFPSYIISQTPAHQWVQPLINNSQLIHPPRILMDQQDHVIVGGIFQNTMDFNFLEEEELREGNMFVLKMTSERELIWVKTFEAEFTGPGGFGMDIDRAGNVYFTSSFVRKISETFSQEEPIELLNFENSTRADTYFLKLNGANGDLEYIYSVSPEGAEFGQAVPLSIAVSDEGKVGLLGYFDKEAQFVPHGAFDQSKGNNDIYFIQYTNEGQYEWHRTFGGQGYDYGYACDYDSEGNIVIGGVFFYTLDFDNGPDEFILKNNGTGDIFILKINPQNKIVWGESLGSARHDVLWDLQVGLNNEIWVTAGFSARMDIDPSPDKQELIIPNENSDGLTFGLTDSGQLIWYNVAGGMDYDYCDYIYVDKVGNVYSSCYVPGKYIFQEDGVKVDLNGNFNALMRKYTPHGEIEWGFGLSNQNGNTSAGWPSILSGDIIAGSNGDLFVSGSFAYGLDFDPTIEIDSVATTSTLKLFLQKLKHCIPSFHTMEVSYVDQFTLNDGTVIKSNGNYMDTLIDRHGCDSIIVYQVNILDSAKAFSEIKLGPVPANNYLNLWSNHSIENCTFTLFNGVGQLVWKNESVDILPPKIELSPSVLNNLPSGLYVLRLQKGEIYRDFKLLFFNK